MSVLDKETRNPSVPIAKERLKSLLVSDRIQLNPDTCELLRAELYRAVTKYMSVTEDKFNVEITRSKIYITITGEEV